MKLHARRGAAAKNRLGKHSARIQCAAVSRLPSARRSASTGAMGELSMKSTRIRADFPADEIIPSTKHTTERHRIKGAPDNAWTIRF
jgi:hypothetical protein